jgi:hypothetical protein
MFQCGNDAKIVDIWWEKLIMSVIVAKIDETNHRLYFGGDRRNFSEDRLIHQKFPKFNKYKVPNSSSELFLGFVGEGKQCYDLMNNFTPEEHSATLSVGDYIIRVCSQFKEIIRELDNLSSDNHGLVFAQVQCLIGYCGRIFKVTNRLDFLETDLMYEAVGSGGDLAIGVLGFIELKIDSEDVGEDVEAALIVSEKFNPYVGSPFDIDYIEIPVEHRWYLAENEDEDFDIEVDL